ncbi:MAG: virulence-associated E family protein [Pseudomonadota bacterium]
MNEITIIEEETEIDRYEVMLNALDEVLIKRKVGEDAQGNPIMQPIANTANALTMLRMHPDWEGVLAYNVFTREEMLTLSIPGSPDDNGKPFSGRPMEDRDYVWAMSWFDAELPGLTKTVVMDAVDTVVRENRTDPLEQHIERCFERWDTKPRIERLFDDYFVARDPGVYTKELGRIMMMALVLRAFHTGAFLKMVPILEGDQDIGKSTGLKALCPEEAWFIDELPPLGSKDAALVLHGVMLAEMAELNAVTRAQMDQVKAYTSKTHDKVREPYGRKHIWEPRRCMFVGTTNEDNYLRDQTGNVRFYPVEVVQVNVEAIRRDRDQLLGEAAVLLEQMLAAGKAWWKLSPEAQAVLGEVREAKSEDDTWTSVVEAFVRDLDEVSTREILVTPTAGLRRADGITRKGLGFDDKMTELRPGNRVANILKRLGWRREGLISKGTYKAQARYVPAAAAKAARAVDTE